MKKKNKGIKKRKLSKGFYILLIIVFLIISVFSSQFFSVFHKSDVSFTYTYESGVKSLKIGNKVFSATELRYTCEYMGDMEVRYPKPTPDCWQTEVIYNGMPYEFTANQPVKISSLITVTMQPEGKVNFTEDYDRQAVLDDDWKATYTFVIKNDDLLSSDASKVKSKMVLNSDQPSIINIENRLASFGEDHAGYWIRTNHKLLERGEGWKRFSYHIYEGDTSYLVPCDTSELGKAIQEIQPFIQIDADDKITIVQENPIQISYEVVLEIPQDNISGNGSSKEQETTPSYKLSKEQESWFQKIIDFLFGWIK